MALSQNEEAGLPAAASPRLTQDFSEMNDSDSASYHSVNQKEEASLLTVSALSPEGPRSTTSRLDRKESYKAQRRSYAQEKKRVEQELSSTFKNQSIVVLADWLKVRGSLKSWTKLWCVLKPGLLLLYKSQKIKSSNWIGTIILSTCELIQRPSKKNGFCFKVFHAMDQSIWAAKGPEGEAMGAMVQPFPTSHLIFRAPNNAAGKCWMDALELALRCSSLLLRTMSSSGSGAQGHTLHQGDANAAVQPDSTDGSYDLPMSNPTSLCLSSGEEQPQAVSRDASNDSDAEKFFRSSDMEETGSIEEGVIRRPADDVFDDDDDDDFGDDEEYPDTDGGRSHREGSNGSVKNNLLEEDEYDPAEVEQTQYEPDPMKEVFGDLCDQTEEISDENKSIVWFLVKQVRPGMDLSKVVLPTFILEPRSFLDKISDYYYHADILSDAIRSDSPLCRIQTVVRWYLSGFYKRPKGLKKPYNPILGERFRCYWNHPNGSRTFYIAEQVSHHPPISAFYVTNRQEGFVLTASILAKSKFYGNSTSAVLNGVATLSLLPRGEDYKMTMPYAHCKGILVGTMTIELGGKVTIECSNTGYSAELEFKLKPFLGGSELENLVTGKIKLGKETLFTLDGHWDSLVTLKDKKTGEESVLWQVTEDIKTRRLKRYTVPLQEQTEFESARLWAKVSAAIEKDDQKMATDEKFILEDKQRAAARELKASALEWWPKSFELDPINLQYIYKHSDARPWDPLNDVYTYERDFVVCTKTKHKTPIVRTRSIVSVSVDLRETLDATSNGQDVSSVRRVRGAQRRNMASRERLVKTTTPPVSGSSEEGGGQRKGAGGDIEKSRVSENLRTTLGAKRPADDDLKRNTFAAVDKSLALVQEQNSIMCDRMNRIQVTLEQMKRSQAERDSNSNLNRDMVLLVILVVMIQAVLNWVLSSRVHQSASGVNPAAGGIP